MLGDVIMGEDMMMVDDRRKAVLNDVDAVV